MTSVLYYDGGEALLHASAVWARPKSSEDPPVRITHHKMLSERFGDAAVDVLVVPLLPGATNQPAPAQQWWESPPAGAWRGTTSHATSKGQNHRIRLTPERKQEARAQFRTLVTHLEAGESPRFVDTYVSRYMRDWYVFAETRGPDRLAAYAKHAVDLGAVTDGDALLDGAEHDLVTLHLRAQHREKSATMNYSPLIRALNPVTGGRPERQLVVRHVSNHALFRSLERIQQVFDASTVEEADAIAAADPLAATTAAATTALSQKVRERVTAEMVAKVKGMFSRGLLDTRFDAVFATVPMSASAPELRQATLRVTLPIGGQKIPMIFVVEPVSETAAVMELPDVGGRMVKANREVTMVNIVTVYEATKEYGWESEGLFRTTRPQSAPESGMTEAARRVLERIVAQSE